jgi:carboxypeptidase C (cathepsin A)
MAAGDMLHTNHDYVAALLHRGIKSVASSSSSFAWTELSSRALIYVGTYDFVCNWVGVEQWTLNMDWTGQEGFIKERLHPWTMNGHTAGQTRSYGGLTYATVDGAGHLVGLI